MSDDHELLRRYAEEGAQEAFAEVVRRHVNLVYSAALRQVNGDAHLAADATQLVFTDLARKARALAGHRVLAGWLFTSTRFAARNLVRTERRRRARELEAFHMESLDKENATPELDWGRVRPVLDDVLNELGRADREAVLLRYFEGRDYANVAARLNLSPNTARMRVERALDKLRERLARRGVASTSAALAAALAGQAVAAAPSGLAATVTGAALAGTTTATGVLAAAFMSVTKLQVGVAAALVVAGAGGYWVQAVSLAEARAEIAALQKQSLVAAQLKVDNARLARAAAEVADLRLDDALLAQLRDEAAELSARWRTIAATEGAKAATAAARPVAVAGEALDISKVDRPPRPLLQARPSYPADMRLAGVSGNATVSFVVDTEGAVQDVKAVKSSRREFEAAAMEAVAKSKFSPAEKGGRKVNARLAIPIIFTVNDGPAGPPPPFWFPSPVQNQPKP